jgi:hypothetical protein
MRERLLHARPANRKGVTHHPQRPEAATLTLEPNEQRPIDLDLVDLLQTTDKRPAVVVVGVEARASRLDTPNRIDDFVAGDRAATARSADEAGKISPGGHGYSDCSTSDLIEARQADWVKRDPQSGQTALSEHSLE